MMWFSRFFSMLLLMTSLSAISIITTGCYTKFTATDSITHHSSSGESSEIDVEKIAENGGSVTINNYYYDAYYVRFMRPTIYGFGSIWSWYDPFWDYPLWYSPFWYRGLITPIGWYGFVPVYYGWGVWGWRSWTWSPYFAPSWGSSGFAAIELGKRRTAIGRMRLMGSGNSPFPASSTGHSNSSPESSPVSPTLRRQQTGTTTTTAPAEFSPNNRRTSTRENRFNGKSREQHGGYSAPSRRQSSRESSSPSYTAPSLRSAPLPSAPSSGGSGSSGSSSPIPSGRRQR